ncbi:MAG: amidinotransferase [Chloroflexi bacterium]|nr:amidinotransferase [Chloroflexota bacterium]
MVNAADRHFLLCPPTYYDVEYAINDWMDVNNRADKALAEAQWQELVAVYQRLGVQLTMLEPVPGIPELVFPGDSIFLYGNQAIASNFRHRERAPEVEPKVAWFAARGFTVHRLPEAMHFEGNAELIRWGDRFLGGYGVRSDAEALAYISQLLDIEVIPLRLKQPFFHLDVTVLPLDADTLAFVPDAFERESCELVQTLAPALIPVNMAEARELGCNSMVVGDTVVMSTPRAPRFAAALEAHGFTTAPLDLTEFFKSGGGVKCLTLEHYPEGVGQAAGGR